MPALLGSLLLRGSEFQLRHQPTPTTGLQPLRNPLRRPKEKSRHSERSPRSEEPLFDPNQNLPIQILKKILSSRAKRGTCFYLGLFPSPATPMFQLGPISLLLRRWSFSSDIAAKNARASAPEESPLLRTLCVKSFLPISTPALPCGKVFGSPLLRELSIHAAPRPGGPTNEDHVQRCASAGRW